MASRAFGALLALIAAIAFAGALVSAVAGSVADESMRVMPAWWDGHPRVDGRVIDRKDVHIGPLGAIGCNLGERQTCEDVAIAMVPRIVGLVELALTGLGAVIAMVLLISAWRVGDRRKQVAKLAIVAAALVAGGAGALTALGPQIQAGQIVDAPIGLGLILLWGAAGTTTLAGLLTLRIEREPLRLKVSKPNDLPPPVDMREVLRNQHGGVGPASLGPEPMLGGPMPPSPGGNLAGPAGPLGGQPLYNAAPQLRPLYDLHGGGMVPSPPTPALPLRAPTPIPRASINAIVGIPTPPPMAIPATPTPTPEASRAKRISAPPAHPADRAESEPIPPPPYTPNPDPPRTPSKIKTKPPSSKPPAKLATKPPRPKPVTKVPMPAPRTSQPTIAHAVPPMPTPDNQPAPSVLPGRAATENDPKLETGLRDTDFITAVEIDAEAKAAAIADRAATLQARDAEVRRREVETAQLLDGDTGVDKAAAPPAPDLITSQERALQADEMNQPRAEQGDVPGARPDEVPVAVTEQLDARGLDQTMEQNPKPPVAPLAEVPASRASQVPMSTAPTSLPPPKETRATTSGPTPACPQCEAPMAWVEEHLRFYCKQCRMYF